MKTFCDKGQTVPWLIKDSSGTLLIHFSWRTIREPFVLQNMMKMCQSCQNWQVTLKNLIWCKIWQESVTNNVLRCWIDYETISGWVMDLGSVTLIWPFQRIKRGEVFRNDFAPMNRLVPVSSWFHIISSGLYSQDFQQCWSWWWGQVCWLFRVSNWIF